MSLMIARKFVFMLVSLFVLITATFFLMKAVPGDPFTSEKTVPPEVRANLNKHYGLDKPLFVQYTNYIKNIAQGDLGVSMKQKFQTVNKIIGSSFYYSFRLGIVSLIVSILLGVWLGALAALHHRRLIDNSAMTFAVFGMSVPNFVLAAFLQYFLGVKLGLFHVAGLREPMDYVLPTIALSALPIAFIARLTRTSMLEVLSADYIKTAKAKGLALAVITYKHALRNAILPVVTYFGPLAANVITGSVVVEKIFGIPGLGKYFVDSVFNRDYPVIMGITIFYAIILMITRFCSDVAYIFVDPRIKLTSGKEEA